MKEIVESIKDISNNLKDIFNLCSKLSPVSIIALLIAILGGTVITISQKEPSLSSPEIKDPYKIIKPLLARCELDTEDNCLLRMQTEYGLYKVEDIERFLTSEEKEILAKEMPSIEERAVLYKNKIQQQANSRSNEISSQDISPISEEQSQENISLVKHKKVAVIAVEFANDGVFDEGVAASCTNSEFFRKSIELKDPLNLENNTVVDVVQPINCNSKTEVESLKECGTYPRVQILFSEASKLYPLQYDPDKNINTLGRCGLAQVEILNE